MLTLTISRMRDVECLRLALIVGNARMYIKYSSLVVKQVGTSDVTMYLRVWYEYRCRLLFGSDCDIARVLRSVLQMKEL